MEVVVVVASSVRPLEHQTDRTEVGSGPWLGVGLLVAVMMGELEQLAVAKMEQVEDLVHYY